MGVSKRKRKSLILIVLLILFLAAYSLFYRYFDMASAPFISADDAVKSRVADDPKISSEPSGLPVMPITPRASPVPDDFVTIRLSASDISRGCLLLINNDHYYDITADNDLIEVSGMNTASYKVANEDILLDASVIGALNDMMDAFYDETGRDSTTIISGFRDYSRQQAILDDYIKLTGPVEALKWAAPPGHSEHHAGLAIDLGIFSGGTIRTFTGTGINAWFRNNSYRFGFILRFPKEKTGITGTADEPWHFRFVDNPHAYFIFKNGWCLEEYIEFIMGYSYEEPYSAVFNGKTYEIYYTPETELRIPFDCEFDYSGNNIEGFIVTIRRQPD